jgi:hypothetical protein
MSSQALCMLSIAAVLTGCGSTRMYEGDKLDRSQVALLFIHERPNMRFTKIDGKAVNFIYDGQVLEFRPGRHMFDVDLSTYRAYGTGVSISYTANFTISSHALELDMKPGYTYVLDFYGINVEVLPDELCFQGEPHDAPGSSVNPTGEYRKMSPSAESFACARAYSTRPNHPQ